MRPDLLGGPTGHGAVLVGKGLHGVTEVAEQMPSVGDLDRGGRTLTDPISTPGRLLSQAATVAASRSGKRSTTAFVSRSTITVP
jgi:hypothetical protein